MPTNLDPLLQAILPGATWVILAAITSVFGVLLWDSGWHFGVWVAGIPERRRQARLELLRAVIRDWNRDE